MKRPKLRAIYVGTPENDTLSILTFVTSLGVDIECVPSITADNIDAITSACPNLVIISLDEIPAQLLIDSIQMSARFPKSVGIISYTTSFAAPYAIASSSQVPSAIAERRLKSEVVRHIASSMHSLFPQLTAPKFMSAERDRALQRVLFGTSERDFDLLSQEFSFSLQKKNLQICLSYPNDYSLYDHQENLHSVYNLAKALYMSAVEHIFSRCPGVEAFMLAPQITCILLNRPIFTSKKLEHETMSSLFSKLADVMRSNAVYVSKAATNVQDILLQYKSLLQARRYRLFFHQYKIMTNMLPFNFGQTADMDAVDYYLNQISAFSTSSTDQEIASWFQSLFLKTLKPAADLDAYFFVCSTIITVIRRFCKENQIADPVDLSAPLFQYKRLWIEDACRIYTSAFQDIKHQAERNKRVQKTPYLKIIDYIHSNYSNPALTLSSCSCDLHISKASICHLFKTHGSITFTDYVNQLRINTAIQMFSTKASTIQNMATAVGFSDPKYFSRIFKRYTGCSPQQYITQNFL